MVHYHHFRVIALNVILLEVVIIVKNDPSQNRKEKQKSKKWQDKKLECLVEYLHKRYVIDNNTIKYFTHLNFFYVSNVSIAVFLNWLVQ